MLKKSADWLRGTQVWKSIFRHGPPTTARNRTMVMLSNVFLHLHPVRARASGIRLSFTWCMGGLTFFLFLVESVTGILLMFYYRPVAASAYADIMALREDVRAVARDVLDRWGKPR